MDSSDSRRTLLISLASAAMATMSACESEPKPSPTATLVNNEGVHQAVTNLIAAVDSLNADVSRFDEHENWRDVVPDVKVAAENVASATIALRAALGY